MRVRQRRARPAGCWGSVGDIEDRVVPTLVPGELEGKKVLQAAAGAVHTVCVADDGSVFAFGFNVTGQLGVGHRENRLLPTLLRGELENKPVLQVAAGGAHTIFVTAAGLVFACGSNGMGALGVGGTESRLVPTLVTGQLQGKRQCTLQQAVITRCASKQTAPYLDGVAITAVSWVLGTQSTGWCQRWSQGCRASK